MNKVFAVLAAFLSIGVAYSQSANVPLNADYYHLIDRYEIMSGSFTPHLYTSAKPYQRKQVAAFADQVLADSSWWNRRDLFNLLYLANDNWEYSEHQENDSRKAVFRKFFRKKSDLFHVEEKDFDLHVNPVFYFSGGLESASDVTLYTNTRGVDVRGNIAGKVGFYSSIHTTQAAFPAHVRQYTGEKYVVPYEGFWKGFKENGVDFFTARGHISANLVKEYVNFQLGFDKNTFGNGHRSFFLSDFSNNYTFLKLNTKIWRINYTNTFMQAYAEHVGNQTGSFGTLRYPKKFIANHHLSINITDNINIGLFEAVVSGDTTGSFNVGYLNPIIFYRSLEHQDGSLDNAMVGMDYKINFARHFSFYGQFMLDEFKLDEVLSGEGWWANKFGIQTGLKYINVFGIDNLDAQLEYNLARPYMYQHQDIYTNYAHYSMPLAHPLGGNFTEIVSFLRYQPAQRLSIVMQLNMAKYGTDPDEDTNWGGDVMKDYTTRALGYGNKIGQGVATTLLYGETTVSYQVKHNVFFDLRAAMRDLQSDDESLSVRNVFYSGSFRWNIPRRTHDF